MKPLIALLAAASVLGAPLAAAAAPDISGMWWIKDRSEKAAVDAAALPLLPEAAKAYAANRAAVAAGKSVPTGVVSCLPDGMPRLMLARYPLQILQRPEQITMLMERQHMVRMIYMNQAPEADPEPAYNGHSVGRWDGDALVVETHGLKGGTVMDATGIPQSEAAVISERLTLEDGGQTLRDRVTVTDPKTFTAPVTFSIDYARAPGERLMEDVCTFGPPQRDRAAKK